MPKKTVEKSSFQGTLIYKLKQNTETEFYRILTSINVAISTLFFDIGTIINEELPPKYTIAERNNLIKDIANSLQSVFGNYLNARNLSLMSKFAKRCTSEKIKYAAAVINSNYLPYFLKLKYDDAWIFYAELIYNESLTPTALQQKIAEKYFEKTKVKINSFGYEFMFVEAKTFYQNTHELYFGRKNGENYRKLFEPQKNYNVILDLATKQKQINHDIICNIQTKTIEFNYELNVNFNSMLFEVGNQILKQSKFLNDFETRVLIDYCIQELNKNCTSIFNEDNLYCCLKFAKQYEHYRFSPTELLQVVSWPYIKVLIEINGINKQSFIANLVLKNDISLQKLNEMIVNGSFDIELSAEQINETIIKRTITTSRTTEKNFTTTGTMITFESSINPTNDLNRNIFKNPELLKFLKEHTLFSYGRCYNRTNL